LFPIFTTSLRVLPLIFALLITAASQGQVRLARLVLKAGEVYEMKGTDILVIDTLIMYDSSRIVLNHLVRDNFIHARKAIFHSGTIIEGKGVHGLRGRNGRSGTSPSTPCGSGGSGYAGTEGTNGGHGLTLSLYLSDVVMKGTLMIDVSGGDAGDGGMGGPGGGGGPGTRLCAGGNGGNGGMGSNGGVGGDAGSVNFIAPRIPELRSFLGEKIIVRNYGGNLGLGGDGGPGGYAGLSPVGNPKMDGKKGRKGIKGKDGVPGKSGSINFLDK